MRSGKWGRGKHECLRHIGWQAKSPAPQSGVGLMAVDLDRVRGRFPGRSIDYYPSIDSTQNAAGGRPFGAVVVAGEQTAGQGRHGHSWHSEAGSGLYCSIVMEPTPVLTLALGLA